MKRIVLYILVSIFIGGMALAGDVGLNSPFSFGTGAYELSLGGACQASCRPVTAPYWNPSSLAGAEQVSASAFHCRLYDADVAYQYFGLALPSMDWGCVGLGVFRLGIDGIEVRDEDNVLLNETQDSRLAFYLAYGKTVSQYNLGLSISFERHQLENYRSTSSPAVNLSIGRDFGFGSSRFTDMKVALNLRNVVNPGMKLVDETVKYPFTFDLACSFRMRPFSTWDQNLVISSALGRKADHNGELSFGAEYNFGGLLSARGGARDGQPTFGCGLNYKILSFDYAVVDRDLGALHMFSLTTSLGQPLSVKRKIRLQKREETFRDLMNEQLESRNRNTIENLVETGKQLLEAGDIEEAGNHFDKALFLARNSDIDTTEICQLAQSVGQKLEEIINKRDFALYMDSAEAKFSTEDYPGAMHFATLALKTNINNSEAERLMNRADSAIEQTLSHEEMVNTLLLNIDSLLNYGNIEQALIVAQSLAQYNADDERIILALKRTQFEKRRTDAADAFNGKEYKECISELDSALLIFPKHKQCLELKARAEIELDKVKAAVAVKPEVTTPAPLSADLKKEIEEKYNTAREYFEKGDLAQAVEYWERIERIAPNYMSVREYLVRAYKFIGVELYGKNKLQDAIVVWEKASTIDPGNQEIIDYIKRTYTEIKRLEELSYEHE